MRSIRTLTLGVAVSAAAAVGIALPTSATAATVPSMPAALAGQLQLPHGGTITGPMPAAEPSFTEPAGEVCTFALRVHTDVNQTKVIRYTDASGRVADEFYYGPLISTATNLSNGKHERLNLSARGLFVYGADGSTDIYGIGPYGIGLHSGDRPGPFFAVPNGFSDVHISPAGQKTVVYASSLRNVCAELS